MELPTRIKSPVGDKQNIAKFLMITVQLGLLVLVILQFELESRAFYHTTMLFTFFGFLIHHFLPLRYACRFLCYCRSEESLAFRPYERSAVGRNWASTHWNLSSANFLVSSYSFTLAGRGIS